MGKRKDEIERFRAHVEKQSNGCWIWRGARSSGGYGLFMVGSKAEGTKKLVIASRFQYERFFGPIPKGAVICHSCDNPPCVNPEHLWKGTNRDNTADARQKGRLSGNRTSGEAHSNSVLTNEQAREMRALRARGVHYKEVMQMFGVSATTFYRVTNGRGYKNVD